MARSYQTPLRISASGGIALTPSDDAGQRSLEQVIVARLLPGIPGHPWRLRDGHIVPGATYSVAGASQNAEFRGYVRRMFTQLRSEGRAELISVEMLPGGASGRRVVNIHWRNLERGGVPQTTSAEV